MTDPTTPPAPSAEAAPATIDLATLLANIQQQLATLNDRLLVLEDAVVEPLVDNYLLPGNGNAGNNEQHKMWLYAHRSALQSMRAAVDAQRLRAAAAGVVGGYVVILNKVIEGMNEELKQTERRLQLAIEGRREDGSARNILDLDAAAIPPGAALTQGRGRPRR